MISTTIRAMLSLTAVLAGCAGTDIHSTVGTSADVGVRTREQAVHESRAVRLAAETLRCMLGRSDDSTCAQVAQQACITPAAFSQWNPAAIEQITEQLSTISREERLSNSTRGALLRWFDLGAAAVREARAARAGAACSRAESCRRNAQGSPSVDDVESAWRGDVRGVQLHAAFDSLLACAVDAEDLSAEVQATALAVFADRLDSAANARPEVRTEAVRAVVSLEATLEGAVDDSTGTPARDQAAAAHESGDETGAAVEHARLILHRRIGASPSGTALRVLVQVAEAVDVQGPVTRASANPCTT